MNLKDQHELKNKMLTYREKFMKEKFSYSSMKIKDFMEDIQEMIMTIMDIRDDHAEREKLKEASRNLALYLNHAEFTYNPNDPEQLQTMNDLMKDASGLLQLHGERLNEIIDNYPEIAAHYEHIFENYPGAVAEARMELSPHQEPTMGREMSPSPSRPAFDYTP